MPKKPPGSCDRVLRLRHSVGAATGEPKDRQIAPRLLLRRHDQFARTPTPRAQWAVCEWEAREPEGGSIHIPAQAVVGSGAVRPLSEPIRSIESRVRPQAWEAWCSPVSMDAGRLPLLPRGGGSSPVGGRPYGVEAPQVEPSVSARRTPRNSWHGSTGARTGFGCCSHGRCDPRCGERHGPSPNSRPPCSPRPPK